MHGPSTGNATPLSIETDFVPFCLLAQRRHVLPKNWDWVAFLKVAAQHVSFSFDKSDAKERWGSENVFNAMGGGGRSLRYTGEQIYGSPVNHPGISDQAQSVQREVNENMLELQEKYLGGTEAWRRFRTELATTSTR